MEIYRNSQLVGRSQQHPSLATSGSYLPGLPLEGWAATKDTLHLWLQVVGRIKLAYLPPKNHWWHETLYPDVRGLTTRRIPVDESTRLEIAVDLVDHFVSITTNIGAEERLDLHDGFSVTAFEKQLHAMLERLGVDVAIVERPYGVATTTDLKEDEEHSSYDRDAVARFWRILDWSDTVFEDFSGWFCGKTSPVQLYWHSLGLAFTRFNVARAAAQLDADPVTQEAYSHEVIAFGFWPGDEQVPEPSYYAYAAPEPAGLSQFELAPPARWSESTRGSLALLPFEAVLRAPNPGAILRAFLQSAYEAGATAAGWDMAALESSWCPTPRELSKLASAHDEVR